MANSNYNTMKKEELIEALQNKDAELNNVKSDIDTLKQMMLELQKGKTPVVEIKQSKDADVVRIGSCLVGRHILCDENRHEIVDFQDFGDVVSISVRLLDSVMTISNKELFRKGLIYFLDDEMYERYSIRKPVVLDDETFDNIYKKPIQQVLKEIDKITENRADKTKEYMVYWKIVRNIAEGREGYQDRNKELELNSYFGTDISNSINLLKCAKELNYK